MKRLIFYFSVFLGVGSIADLSYGQNPWQWANQIGGSGIDFNGGLVIDQNNDIYCGGNYEIDCYLDIDTLSALGFNDMLLAKYDASGNEKWAKTFGGNNSIGNKEQGAVVLLDRSGTYLYYIGHFADALILGSDTLNSASTGFTMFISKFDLSGNPVWTVGFGSGSTYDFPAALAQDTSDHLYFTGNFGNNGYIGGYTINKGCFLATLDSNGVVLTARDEIKGGYITCMNIHDEKIVFCGIGNNDTTIVDTATFITTNQAGLLVGTLQLNGNFINGKRFVSNSIAYPNALCLDNADNLYMVGEATDSINFDGLIFSNNGLGDLFFCKFDSKYDVKWVRQSNSTGSYGAHGGGIVSGNSGDLFVCGSFSGNASFGAFGLVSSATMDMFLARYDTSGLCLDIRQFGEARAESVKTDSNGDVVVSGAFINTVTIGTSVKTSHGSTDVFIAKSDAATKISELDSDGKKELVVYPNPAMDELTILVPRTSGTAEITAYDLMGRQVMQQRMATGKITLDVASWPQGVYIIEMKTPGWTSSTKFIKQ